MALSASVTAYYDLGILIVAKEKKSMDFEQQLASLEALVESLESGELSLEESLKSFEQGIAVARDCQAALKQAEQKVEVLMRQGDELVSKPFEDQQQ